MLDISWQRGTESATLTGREIRIALEGKVLRSALAVLCLGTTMGACGERNSRQPNVILIVVDTLRAANVSFMSYPRETTPHLDVLAKTSFVFEQAVSVGANTPTTMAGIMTGRFPFVDLDDEYNPRTFHGMQRFYEDEEETGLPRNLRTLAEHLVSAGYTTAGVITNPYLKENYNFHRGFQEYTELFYDEGVPYGRGEDVSRHAVNFLESAPDGPFLLYLHYMDSHGPYWPPEPFRTKYADRELSPDEFSSLWRHWDQGVGTKGPDVREYMQNLYDGAVAYTDACIGRVLQSLADQNLTDDTIIVVTADHGDEFLEHGGTTHKATLYEEIVRVPLLVHVPKSNGGRVRELVRNFDVMPTILEMAGVDTAGLDLDASDLGAVFHGKKLSMRRTGFAASPRSHMLRTARHKLLRFKNERYEFYDLSVDPAEQNNLAGSRAAISNAADESIFRRMKSHMSFLSSSFQSRRFLDTPAPSLDEETYEQLRALGYIQ